MAKLSRLGDRNEAGGQIMRGAATVYANNIKVGLHISQLSPHHPWGKPHPPHRSASTTDGSPTVFSENCPVLRVGSGNTCGHRISEGSSDINVP